MESSHTSSQPYHSQLQPSLSSHSPPDPDLIHIVQNSATNKMAMENIRIVFSPTLGIPLGVFSLMLEDLKRVFNVVGDKAASDTASIQTDRDSQLDQKHSEHNLEPAADQLLGLSVEEL
ncbi:Rho GTPase activating protein [Marasmius crinis-equi]|uniref:Rho GTPase activating protein n=1 Tax=Marasmius crinis-equi TaxID=585013 RepID=A0ABR3ERY9_9AGAR